MNNVYHGILVNVSQKDRTIFENLKIIGKCIIENTDWILYKIETCDDKLENTIKLLQLNMLSHYYFHFYKNADLIVVFKNKIFQASTDNSTWKKIIEYGLKINIPLKQLDFSPCKFEDETY